MQSQVLDLTEHWQLIYGSAAQVPSLTLTFDTSAMPHENEASLRALFREVLKQINSPLSLICFSEELDTLSFTLTAENTVMLCHSFVPFFDSFLELEIPEPLEEAPLSCLEEKEKRFQLLVLHGSGYEERAESLALRGVIDITVRQLLKTVSLSLELNSLNTENILLGQVMSMLQPVFNHPLTFECKPKQTASLNFSEPFVQNFSANVLGVWFDVAFRLPATAEEKVYGYLLADVVRDVFYEKPLKVLSTLDIQIHYFRFMGYLRFKLHGEQAQDLLALQEEIFNQLIYIKHHSFIQSRFQAACHKLQPFFKKNHLQHIKPNFLRWKSFAHRYMSSDYLCMLQTYAQAEHSPRYTVLKQKYPLLGYVSEPEKSGFVLPYHRQQKIYGKAGRQISFLPDTNQPLTLELHFESGTLLEPHAGTLYWLSETLLCRLQSIALSHWSTSFDEQQTSFYVTVRGKELPVLLRELKMLLTEPLVPDKSLKQVLAAKRCEASLDPKTIAQAHFLQTAFPNHLYGRLLQGTYHSLKLIQPHHVQSLWELFKKRSFELTLRGKIPAFLEEKHVLPIVDSLPSLTHHSLTPPSYSSRRGRIQAELPEGYSGVGRAFLLPDEHICQSLQFLSQQLFQRLRCLPVEHVLYFFSTAGYLFFSGYEVSKHIENTLMSFHRELLDSEEHLARVLHDYYLTGSDWIQIIPHKHHAFI